PLYGDLAFEDEERGVARPVRGDNVGREWEYRQYISGSDVQKQQAVLHYAVWTFPKLPGGLAERDRVRCEFTFDIFRTNKLKENEGIQCTFFFESWRFRDAYRADYEPIGDLNPEVDNPQAKKFGFYSKSGLDITDYHTEAIELPAALLRNQTISREDL